jgi:plasmid stabilization system protein ParE
MARASRGRRARDAPEAVAHVVYSPASLAHLERAFDFLRERAPDAAVAAAAAIQSAVSMLEHHPMIGRVVADDVRELVISYGRTGYVALYRFLPARDEVRVLAIRHQRELDYPA